LKRQRHRSYDRFRRPAGFRTAAASATEGSRVASPAEWLATGAVTGSSSFSCLELSDSGSERAGGVVAAFLLATFRRSASTGSSSLAATNFEARASFPRAHCETDRAGSKMPVPPWMQGGGSACHQAACCCSAPPIAVVAPARRVCSATGGAGGSSARGRVSDTCLFPRLASWSGGQTSSGRSRRPGRRRPGRAMMLADLGRCS
jgi:hypothetical protein